MSVQHNYYCLGLALSPGPSQLFNVAACTLKSWDGPGDKAIDSLGPSGRSRLQRVVMPQTGE